MITNVFIPELNNHDVQELWFQQDGATCHTARVTIDLLKDTFGDRLISRFGPVNWPPRSCDLTPLDYFLWGYVKSLVYADKPQTLDHLEDNIRRFIADIRPQMMEKVIEHWTSRLAYIRARRGSHMPEIIFKISPHLRRLVERNPLKKLEALPLKTLHAPGIVPSRPGVTLNSHRAASPLVQLVEEEGRWKAPDYSQGSSSKLGWNRIKLHCHLYGAQSKS
ncbi:putative DD41D transposase [Trichonephila clavipes]|nr:putative DD41D transposase [Trichonephila clavipes]